MKISLTENRKFLAELILKQKELKKDFINSSCRKYREKASLLAKEININAEIINMLENDYKLNKPKHRPLGIIDKRIIQVEFVITKIKEEIEHYQNNNERTLLEDAYDRNSYYYILLRELKEERTHSIFYIQKSA